MTTEHLPVPQGHLSPGATLGMIAAMVCVWTVGRDIAPSATQWATLYGSMFAGACVGMAAAAVVGAWVYRWEAAQLAPPTSRR